MEGEIDPRLIVRFFPDLRGNLFGEEDTVDVFSGVAEHLPLGGSIDEIGKNHSFPFFSFIIVIPISFIGVINNNCLELTRSCCELSQELFALSRSKHPRGAYHSRTASNIRHRSAGYANNVSAEM